MTVKEYVNDDHWFRKLLKCNECGQMYFYEMVEEIDWVHGNDPQYRTYIPVESEGVAREMSSLSKQELMNCFPRLHHDWPSNAKRPKTYWNK